jgi:histidyl-tRNA synthetase
VVGSNSLVNDVEFAEIYLEVFNRIGIDVDLKINNRKILKGIMEVCGLEDKEKKILVMLDKTDKIGISGVKDELIKENIAIEKLEMLLRIYALEGTNGKKIQWLKDLLNSSKQGLNGIADIEFVLNFLSQSETADLKSQINLDLTLARGLEYYTGIIYEAKALNVQIGSIGGGGRYDDLTGLFDVPGIPGVGISFGVDRIYDVMEELNLFPENVHFGTTALFFNMGDVESQFAYKYMQQLRRNNVSCELFHEPAKMDKQFKYASKKNISFAIIIGSKEIAEQTCVVKYLAKGEQKVISLPELENHICNLVKNTQ